MTDWRPIESAPKDGQLRLFYCPSGSVYIAPDCDDFPLSADQALAFWRETGEFPNSKWNPTHWMPLPEPPKEEAKRVEWRPHGGGGTGLLDEARVFDSGADLLAFLRQDYDNWFARLENVKAEPYSYDARIDWDTWLITGDIVSPQGQSHTVLGYTNGNPNLPKE